MMLLDPYVQVGCNRCNGSFCSRPACYAAHLLGNDAAGHACCTGNSAQCNACGATYCTANCANQHIAPRSRCRGARLLSHELRQCNACGATYCIANCANQHILLGADAAGHACCPTNSAQCNACGATTAQPTAPTSTYSSEPMPRDTPAVSTELRPNATPVVPDTAPPTAPISTQPWDRTQQGTLAVQRTPPNATPVVPDTAQPTAPISTQPWDRTRQGTLAVPPTPPSAMLAEPDTAPPTAPTSTQPWDRTRQGTCCPTNPPSATSAKRGSAAPASLSHGGRRCQRPPLLPGNASQCPSCNSRLLPCRMQRLTPRSRQGSQRSSMLPEQLRRMPRVQEAGMRRCQPSHLKPKDKLGHDCCAGNSGICTYCAVTLCKACQSGHRLPLDLIAATPPA